MALVFFHAGFPAVLHEHRLSVTLAVFASATTTKNFKFYNLLEINKKPSCRKNRGLYWCRWLLKSSKVDDFYVTWKPICHFLLVINSNPGRIFHRFRGIVSLLLKHAHVFYPHPLLLNPECENVSLALNRWNFAGLGLRHKDNYSCKKFSFTTYRLAIMHPWQKTDRQTDGTSIVAMARPLLKYVRSAKNEQ